MPSVTRYYQNMSYGGTKPLQQRGVVCSHDYVISSKLKYVAVVSSLNKPDIWARSMCYILCVAQDLSEVNGALLPTLCLTMQFTFRYLLSARFVYIHGWKCQLKFFCFIWRQTNMARASRKQIEALLKESEPLMWETLSGFSQCGWRSAGAILKIMCLYSHHQRFWLDSNIINADWKKLSA